MRLGTIPIRVCFTSAMLLTLSSRKDRALDV